MIQNIEQIERGKIKRNYSTTNYSLVINPQSGKSQKQNKTNHKLKLKKYRFKGKMILYLFRKSPKEYKENTKNK